MMVIINTKRYELVGSIMSLGVGLQKGLMRSSQDPGYIWQETCCKRRLPLPGKHRLSMYQASFFPTHAFTQPLKSDSMTDAANRIPTMRLPDNGEHKMSFLYKVWSLKSFVVAAEYRLVIHLEPVIAPTDSGLFTISCWLFLPPFLSTLRNNPDNIFFCV